MKITYNFLAALFAFSLAFSAFSEESITVAANSESKELKRIAHRLHIPVEQLKNARQALQEATDLAMDMKTNSAMPIESICRSWKELNPSNTRKIADAFIHKLRLEAEKAADPIAYIEASSTAISIMRFISEYDFEKVKPFIQGWPVPHTNAEAFHIFLKAQEFQARKDYFMRSAYTDPQKALAYFSSESGEYDYVFSWQIAQGFLNVGKKEAAYNLIDQTISQFSRSPADPDIIQQYTNFLISAARSNLDTNHASAAIAALISKLKSLDDSRITRSNANPEFTSLCFESIKTEDGTSVNLTCAESGVLNVLRSLSSKPGLVIRTLDSLPSLKAELDGIGGIDSLYGYGNRKVITRVWQGSTENSDYSDSTEFESSEKLLRELRGKVKSDPEYVNRRLTEVSKESGTEALTNVIWTDSYRHNMDGDAELGSMALKVARKLNSEAKPPGKRNSNIWEIIRAYRQLEGPLDPELQKEGFRFVDQLKEEIAKPKEELLKPGETQQVNIRTGPCQFSGAECMEEMLLAELSRDSFTKAMTYARSIKNKELKLDCLIMIALALRQPNF
jgi:hypothetical protein